MIIEKDVPHVERRGRKAKYPWADMLPGDSILIPIEGKTPEQVRSRVCASLAHFRQSRHSDWHFTTSYIEHEKGVRVWRKYYNPKP